MTTGKVFHADDKYVLRLLNVVIYEHQFKRKEKYCKFHFDKKAYTKPKNVRIFHMTSCCLRAKIVNNISRNVNLCDFQVQGYARKLYVIRDFRKGCGFILPVCFLYRLSRFPIHECLVILCIAYLSLCTFYKGVSWNSRYKAQTMSIYDVIGHR